MAADALSRFFHSGTSVHAPGESAQQKSTRSGRHSTASSKSRASRVRCSPSRPAPSRSTRVRLAHAARALGRATETSSALACTSTSPSYRARPLRRAASRAFSSCPLPSPPVPPSSRALRASRATPGDRACFFDPAPERAPSLEPCSALRASSPFEPQPRSKRRPPAPALLSLSLVTRIPVRVLERTPPSPLPSSVPLCLVALSRSFPSSSCPAPALPRARA